MNRFKIALIWVWCFPQMLAGLILKIITKAEKHGEFYHYTIKNGSVSLGEYIFLCPAHKQSFDIKKHELGHRKQSLMLGWLYLIVIGLPSFIWANCFKKYREKHKIDYYSFYSERWANKLGRVNLTEG